MNTVSINFESLIKKHPSEKQTTSLLNNLFYESAENKYSKNRLVSLLRPRSTYNFSVYLNDAIKLGILAREIRVVSPSHHQSIQDFESLLSIPFVIYDHFHGSDIPVTPDLLEEVYYFKKGAIQE